MRRIELFKFFGVLVLLRIIFASDAQGNFLKTDFRENRVPKVYEGAYFSDDGKTDFLLDQNFLSFKTKNRILKYTYQVVEVNNYYPTVNVQTEKLNRESVVYQKRYIVLIDWKDRKELAMFLWAVIAQDSDEEGATHLFFHSLYNGKNARDIIAQYKEDKRKNKIKAVIDEKNGIFSGRYTKFFI